MQRRATSRDKGPDPRDTENKELRKKVADVEPVVVVGCGRSGL
jgi:D-arabinose 5-phosphate isomerase GutQ